MDRRLVTADRDGRPNDVRLDGLVALLTRSLQELKKANDQLRSDNEDLRRRMRALERHVHHAGTFSRAGR